ncbi:MAG: hypothetical protein ACRDVM_07445 [Acidimicrobiia bacterium]
MFGETHYLAFALQEVRLRSRRAVPPHRRGGRRVAQQASRTARARSLRRAPVDL